jgi:release factor glutamine methyltransferase
MAKAEASMQRLLNQEPIQYVLGHTCFYGRSFMVSPHVLIPRPETEELVDWIIREHRTVEAEYQIIDIGTGSGCISITLAKELAEAQVTAVDISSQALQTAQANARLNHAELSWIEADILKYEQFPALINLKLDMVVSNPPYVTQAEKTLMHTNVLDYEPHLALFVSNEDPLLFYRRIAGYCQHHLKPGGVSYLEVNEQYAQQVAELLQNYGFKQIHIQVDMFGKERFVKGIK